MLSVGTVIALFAIVLCFGLLISFVQFPIPAAGNSGKLPAEPDAETSTVTFISRDTSFLCETPTILSKH